MRTGDHVRCGRGKKVHLVAEVSGVDYLRLQCRLEFGGLLYSNQNHPTTDLVDCLKCLAKEGKC